MIFKAEFPSRELQKEDILRKLSAKQLEKIQACVKIANGEWQPKLETVVGSRKTSEESITKYRKLRQDWAIKVYQSDPSNEDLENLLSLEPEELFKKYEENSKKKANSDRTKLEETAETLQDVKTKLKWQREQREIYEKQLNEIKEALHFPLPVENYTFANVLTIVETLVELNELSDHSIYPLTSESLKIVLDLSLKWVIYCRI